MHFLSNFIQKTEWQQPVQHPIFNSFEEHMQELMHLRLNTRIVSSIT